MRARQYLLKVGNYFFSNRSTSFSTQSKRNVVFEAAAITSNHLPGREILHLFLCQQDVKNEMYFEEQCMKGVYATSRDGDAEDKVTS
jgi:hypothetical protein